MTPCPPNLPVFRLTARFLGTPPPPPAQGPVTVSVATATPSQEKAGA